MTQSNVTPMIFIETIDGDDEEAKIVKLQINLEKYNQLSQVDTSWKVIFPTVIEYDADDEDEEIIKVN